MKKQVGSYDAITDAWPRILADAALERRVAKLEAALQEIIDFSNLEMKDGDAAREVAERALAKSVVE